MELCSTGTQCTIDPQFYCSRCQEGSGRARRGFLSRGPNLDDFFHRVAIVSVCSFANVPQWTMTFKCRLNSLSFSSFYHLVDWHWDLWNLFACTFPFEASRVWSLTCCGTLFWASSQHAPLSASVLFPWTFSWPEFQCFLVRVNKLFWKSKTWEFIWESNNSKNVNKFRQRTLGVIVFLLLFW